MRKISLLIATGLLASPLVGQVRAEDDAKVFYKEGTNVEFPDAGTSVKVVSQLQSKYTYSDIDDAAARGTQDSSSFDVNRARLVITGSALDKEVSFKLENDFSSDDGGSDLKDAWIQWNADEAANLRAGHFKTPFGAQQLLSETKLQLISRSIVTDMLTIGRQNGAMLHGDVGPVNYMLSITNGDSDGEGANLGGVDPDHLYALMVSHSGGGYDRGTEGDLGTTDGIAYTIGGSLNGETASVGGVDTDVVRLGADAGIRTAGFSLIAEILSVSTEPEGAVDTDDIGYFFQAGYFVVPEVWEVAGRFSSIRPDSDGAESDVNEFTAGVNRYILGHNLKVQTGITFVDTDDADTTDVRYELMATAVL